MGGVTPDWLAQLAPAHAPPPVSAWPPAPGWIALAILLLLLVVALWRGWRHPARRLRRQALAELRRIEAENLDGTALARALAQLLRRYAIARFGREAIAGLTGPAWLAFLAAHGGAPLDGEAGDTLMRRAWGGSGPDTDPRWLAGTRGFLRGRARRHEGRPS
ncbi:DUF4381 domain-containing protein [Nitrogeniibacter mangrovi]|uniref:DUF4381 domain-containing protein n=1 Tax=Nitrogeniibacter mangrovi TaxID=2016596 RepID=A0A6C1B400_9RHOO|nr:DUF4381 domain-containing protein [Nitrogeniibacter mangrovi]QID16924.1 DUF4381 domain-containing protein [Nitrogeniibacter mangrovi]